MSCSRCALVWGAIIVAVFGAVPGFAEVEGVENDRPVTTTYGEPKVIEFDTSEGTWMSVDISPDGKHIVFDLLGHIYRMPSNGGEADCLTCSADQATNFHPKFSPDGQWIAFVSDRYGQQNLWISRVDGSHARPVFLDDDSRIVEPTWMPDSSAVVATRRFKTEVGFIRVRAEIWSFPIARDGGGPSRLVAHDGRQRHWPSVSRDGRYVYFHTMNNMGQAYHLQRLTLSNGVVDDITGPRSIPLFFPEYHRPLGEVSPEVSPDGSKIAFARKVPGGKVKYGTVEYEERTALWMKDLSTGREEILVDPITSDAMDFLFAHKTRVLPGYSWAPDGSFLVFTEGGRIRKVSLADREVVDIPFVARVERTVSEQVRHNGRLEQSGSFRAKALRWPRRNPDGRSLAFEASGQIYTWDFDGSHEPRALAPMKNLSQAMPAWSEDGNWLAFVTWNEEGGGAVWKVRSDGTALTKLTEGHSMYLYPIWSSEKGHLVASRRMPLAPDETNRGVSGGWAIVAINAAGTKSVTVLRESGPAATGHGKDRITYSKPAFSLGEYRRFFSRGETAPRPQTSVYSSNVDGSNSTSHGAAYGDVRAISLSPDGKRMAIELFREIYVAPTGTEPVDVLADQGVRRLTFSGGGYPHWISATKLEFFSANEYRTVDIGSGTETIADVPLDMEYAYGKGELILQGGRVFVGDERLSVLEGADIHVKDGRIICVGQCTTTQNVRTLDVRGKFVMPGWVDVHSHSTDVPDDELIEPKRSSSAAFLAYGITTTSDPGTHDPLRALSLSEMHAAGHVLGPRRLVQGDFIRCFAPDSAENIPPLRTMDDARNLVKRHAGWGVTLLKSYQQCSRRDRQLLLNAAREAGLGVTIEAQDLFLVVGSVVDGAAGWTAWMQYVPIYSDVSRFFGQSKAHYEGVTVLAGYPNAGSLEYWFGQEDWWLDSKAARFLPMSIRSTRRGLSATPKEQFSWPVLALGSAAIVNEGGYAPVSGHSEVPGLDTHWGVWALASGMDNARALRAASYDGAHFLGLEQDLGTIERGKIADLVVLNADPLADIRNTLSQDFVMLRGRVYDPASLDELWPEKTSFGSYPWSTEEVEGYPQVSSIRQ